MRKPLTPSVPAVTALAAMAVDPGITLNNHAGKVNGDHATQTAAIETCIANDAKGVLQAFPDCSSLDARAAGIETVHYPLAMFPARFIGDNILLGRERVSSAQGCARSTQTTIPQEMI